MAKVAAVLPGYTTVAQSSGVLHLAPRSVRDLIYSGRLPSLRIGRLHYVRAADLELERRRRLGLPLPKRKARVARPRAAEAAAQARPARGHSDPALRRERAAERAALVNRWAERHHLTAPELPFAATTASSQAACEVCGRTIRAGAAVLQPAHAETQLCVTCGRRVLLDWADHRRLEAAAARRLAEDLPSTAEPQPQSHRAA